MISPSSDVAVTSSASGTLARSIASEWYRVTANGDGNARKNAAAVVRHRGDLAMHHPLRAHDAAAERLPDRLVPEAYAEDRDLPGEALDQRHRDAGLVGRARPGRDDDLRGAESPRLRRP